MLAMLSTGLKAADKMNRLRSFADRLRTSLWFIPCIMVASSILLALLLIELEVYFRASGLAERYPSIFASGAEGARGMLATIAGSMITVAGVAFSINVVTFSLASSQYSSRVLRTFMRDRANQLILGVFVSIYTYCLVVQRSIHQPDEVPGLAVLGGLLLALVGVGFLIFFIHHVASSIQAASIVSAAAAETSEAIDRMFPAAPQTQLQEGLNAAGAVESLHSWSVIEARTTGYLQSIAIEELLELAVGKDSVIRIERSPGDFIIPETTLASVAIGVDDELERKIRRAFTIGLSRTVYQDPAFGMRQIVDVALKSLSPGINDTTTALICLDYLSAILSNIAKRQSISPLHVCDNTLRLINRCPHFEQLLADAFNPIRQNAHGNAAVLSRIMDALCVIANRTKDKGRLEAIRQQAKLAVRAADDTIAFDEDRAPVQEAAKRLYAYCASINR